jgi:hypothetical protein
MEERNWEQNAYCHFVVSIWQRLDVTVAATGGDPGDESLLLLNSDDEDMKKSYFYIEFPKYFEFLIQIPSEFPKYFEFLILKRVVPI